MSGMGKLASAILEKVNSEANGIIKEAEEKAKTRIEGAKTQRQTKLKAENSRLISEAKAEASRILAQASIRERQEILAAKTRIIDEIISEAKKALATLPDSEKILVSLAREGVSVLGVDKVRVYVAPRDIATMQKLVKEDKELDPRVVEVKRQDFLGGVIVEDVGGKNRIDNTFETRLEMLLPKLLPEIGKELF